VQVTGVDIAAPLVATAHERGTHLPNVSFEVADAAQWQPPIPPQFLVSRHGVMFFDDPVAAFRHFREIAAPGAGLMFSCFREPGENPFFSEVGRLLPRAEPAGDPHAPGPFAFADGQRVETILTDAGWRQIELEPFDFAMIAGAGGDPVEDAVEYFCAIGPAARAASEMALDERRRFEDRVRELAARNLHEGIVSLRAAVWVVTALRS
jgi:SAM-dependent methyltransferase